MSEIAKYIIDESAHIDIFNGKLGFSVEVCGRRMWFYTDITLTPYTEPDTEKIRKEAFDEGYQEGMQLSIDDAKLKEAYQKGLADGRSQDAKDFADMYDSGYSEGLKDAWDAARKIGSNSMYSLKEMGFDFGQCVVPDYNPSWFVVKNYSASECIEKIRQYEHEEKIVKGDVVRIKSAPEVEILVTYADEEYVGGIALTEVDDSCEIGDQFTDIIIHKVEKTGRHYEIAEVLKEMREE